MGESNSKDQIVQVAMNIIINAGDARNFIKESLEAVATQNFDLATEKINQANHCIKIAHQSQTDLIQSEARGEKIEYSVLFSHAQDTLMTISSEYNLAGQLLKIFKSLTERIQNIEEAQKANCN